MPVEAGNGPRRARSLVLGYHGLMYEAEWRMAADGEALERGRWHAVSTELHPAHSDMELGCLGSAVLLVNGAGREHRARGYVLRVGPEAGVTVDECSETSCGVRWRLRW